MQSTENTEVKNQRAEEEEAVVIVVADARREAVTVPLESSELEGDKDTPEKAAETTDQEAAMMPPPAPPVEPQPASSDRDEDEVLSLQVLSARSSTPYTVQAVCCNNANCELGTADSTTVSPVKEEPTQTLSSDEKKNDEKESGEENQEQSGECFEGKRYTRSDLMNIRDEMTTVKPECLGSTRLKRLNLVKAANGAANNGVANGVNRSRNYRSSNSSNDLMPLFFKRKAAVANSNSNGMTYDSFKSSDSHSFANHSESVQLNNNRRIGSGRLFNRDVNWDYIPEEDPDKDKLPEFFTTKDNTSTSKPLRQLRKYESDDNSNYVKRVINSVVGESSFRSGTCRNSNNSSTEDRFSTNSSTNSTANNKSDEPEWFSCGPTSRLDTIELCGFNETDQQQIRMEMETAKNKPDANNNHEEPMSGASCKEKKPLAFQFDDFSKHSGKQTSNNTSNRMPSSKFLPFFKTKNREEEKSMNGNTSQSLSDFLKRSDVPLAQKEKLSLNEIPSVDEIEAKWRVPQQHQRDPRNKSHTTENFHTSSDNFKKMLNQLSGGGSAAPSASQQLQQQPPMNLFNNDNLSNFIKQRNLQQQLIQKQQQQAAFAQLQLNAILSRPDTQLLLLSLARGEISKHGLVVQLANPNLTQADREAISAVLTFSAAGQYHNQLAINSNHQQQQQFIANQLQNLALLQQMNKNASAKRNVGAGGGGGGGGYQANSSNPRSYSHEELQSHANFILHNAMLKKKLEEQTNLGMQKILQLQNSMLTSGYNNTTRGIDSLSGTKNQQQQQPQQQHHQQRRSSNGGGRRNTMGRRRSTSSSSSNTTVNAAQMKLASDLEFCQLEQRRNTLATTTVGTDEFHQISERI